MSVLEHIAEHSYRTLSDASAPGSILGIKSCSTYTGEALDVRTLSDVQDSYFCFGGGGVGRCCSWRDGHD